MDFLVPLIALASMEIVLGIDNLVFITIVTSRLDPERQPLARKLGLAVALVSRLLLLGLLFFCLLYTSPSPRDQRGSRMPSSA